MNKGASPKRISTFLQRSVRLRPGISIAPRPDSSPAVLLELGLQQSLSAEVLDALYTSTGGHLKLANQIVTYAQQRSLLRLLDEPQDRLLASLLVERIDGIDGVAGPVSALLARALPLGLSFDERQLRCLAEDLGHDFDLILDRATRARLLERSGTTVRVQSRHRPPNVRRPSDLCARHATTSSGSNGASPRLSQATTADVPKRSYRPETLLVDVTSWRCPAVAMVRRGVPTERVVAEIGRRTSGR